MSRGDGVVVVGGGQAAHQLATTLRSEGFAGRIRICAEEARAPYQRPPLSKGFLDGSVSEAALEFDSTESLAEAGIELLAGCRVLAVDPSRREVRTDRTEPLGYDSLVLATGARNRRLPHAMPPGVHSIRSVADAVALRDDLAHARRLVVIGAGFLGLEVACAAQNLGLTVDVVEMDHRVMARAVSPDLAVRLGDAHVERGLRIRFGLAVVGFDVGHDGRVSAVQLSDGAHLAADVVVSSIGVVPNSELAAAAGLPVDNGICVDRRLATPAPDVYAIGDCAAFPVGETGRLVRLEAVSNALDQGAHVAAAILGDPRPYEGVPWFWSHQGPVRLQIAGLCSGADEHVLAHGHSTDSYSLLGFADGVLATVESVNRPRDHMTARRMFSGGAAITFDELKNRDFRLAP